MTGALTLPAAGCGLILPRFDRHPGRRDAAPGVFATLRAELIDHERYPTREAAEASIGDSIGGFYNVQRRHSHLDYLSPLEFELRAKVAAFAASSTRPPKPGKITPRAPTE